MWSLDAVLSHHSDLYKYWNAVRGTRAMPPRSDIDPMDIIKILPFVGLIERRARAVAGFVWTGFRP